MSTWNTQKFPETDSSTGHSEYFKTTLKEIETIVHGENAEIEFTKIAEAKEYHQSLQILEDESNKKTMDEVINEEFPEELE